MKDKIKVIDKNELSTHIFQQTHPTILILTCSIQFDLSPLRSSLLIIFIFNKCTRTPTTPIFHQPPPFSTHPHLFQPICTYFNPSAPISTHPPPCQCLISAGTNTTHKYMAAPRYVPFPFLTPLSPFSPPDALHAASNYIHLLLK